MKQIIHYIQEKLKISSDSKINNLKEPTLKDFTDFFDNKNNNHFEIIEILSNTQVLKYDNKKGYNSLIGNCYKKELYSNVIMYYFPLYKIENKDDWYCLNLRFNEVDKIDRINNHKNNIKLLYVNCGTDNGYGLKVNKILSKEKLINYGENIDFELYMKIITELYDQSQDLNKDDFLKEFEKTISHIANNDKNKGEA
jgi:L-cysteine desulfidase